MEVLMDIVMKFVVVIVFFAAVIYVVQAIFLNKFNELIYGKKTAKAWIPVVNLYLLGKLTFSKMMGWILALSTFLNSSLTVSVNEKERVYYFLPDSIRLPFSLVFSIVVLVVFICAIIKYNHLKKVQKTLEKNSMGNNEEVKHNAEVLHEKTETPQAVEVNQKKEEFSQFGDLLKEEVVAENVQIIPNVVVPNTTFNPVSEFVLPEIVPSQEKENTAPEVDVQQPESVNI